MQVVVPEFLWRGNAGDLLDVPALLSSGIAAVVDLAMENPPAKVLRELIYCRFPLVDGGGNPAAVIQAAVAATVLLFRGRLPTLVACGGGMSRSPAIVAAALARVNQTPLEDALREVACLGPHDVSASLWSDIKAAQATALPRDSS